jgi:uncharacterized iron-regulated membrane protein
VTGGLLVFPEYSRWLLSGVPPTVDVGSTRLTYNQLVRHMDDALGPDEQANRLVFSTDPRATVRASTTKGRSITLDPYRGSVIELSGPSTPMNFILRLHTSLAIGPWGRVITGSSAGILCLLGFTGLWLWWPVGRWSRNYFLIRWRRGPKRFNFDLHRMGGLYASAVMLPIGLSGFWLSFSDSIDPWVYSLTGTEPTRQIAPKDIPFERHPRITPDLAVAQAQQKFPGWLVYRLYVPTPQVHYYRVFLDPPEHFDSRIREARLWVHPVTGVATCEENPGAWSTGDAINAWKLALHFGTFGGLPLRWAYLFGSLMPVLLCITGARLWIARRRKRHAAQIASVQQSPAARSP